MDRWERLGAHIAAWRRIRGYRTQKALADATHLGERTIGSLEAGRKKVYREDTLIAVEHVLGWAPGSVQSILDGGEPSTIGQPLDEHLAALITAWDRLPEETRQIIRLIAEERQLPPGR